MRSFDEMLVKVKNNPIKTIAVAAAQDESVLEAIAAAKDQNITNAILIGDEVQIRKIAQKLSIDISKFTVINEMNIERAAARSVEMVYTKKADMVMKGMLHTSIFLKAVLNNDSGLRTGKLISHVAVLQIPGYDRFILLTDAALNMFPDVDAKINIINNAVQVAHAIDVKVPKVAIISAVELVNLKMPSTVDASILSKMSERGQIKGCIVDGPLAVDNALSEEAASHKNISGPVAGKADILLLPNIEVGNAMYKTLIYAANSRSAGILVGASAPVILTSRADSFESKLYSIAIASIVVANK